MTTPTTPQTALQEEVLGWILGLAFVGVGIVINYPGGVSLVAFILFLILRG